MCVKFQIESEDGEVGSFTKSHTNLSYLSLVPNYRIQHSIREFSIEKCELHKSISQLQVLYSGDLCFV